MVIDPSFWSWRFLSLIIYSGQQRPPLLAPALDTSWFSTSFSLLENLNELVSTLHTSPFSSLSVFFRLMYYQTTILPPTRVDRGGGDRAARSDLEHQINYQYHPVWTAFLANLGRRSLIKLPVVTRTQIINSWLELGWSRPRPRGINTVDPERVASSVDGAQSCLFFEDAEPEPFNFLSAVSNASSQSISNYSNVRLKPSSVPTRL